MRSDPINLCPDTMLMSLDRIILGVDFTQASVAAARWIRRDLAPRAELVLVHVIPAGTEPVSDETTIAAARARAKARLQEIVESIRLGLTRAVVRVGDPAEQIADVAAELDADLIVVGPHRLSASTPDTLGSTAERLLAHSPLPVLAVAGAMNGTPTRLLVPVDGGDLGVVAFDWARMLEDRFGTGIAVVHLAHAREPSGGTKVELDGRPGVPRWRQLMAKSKPASAFVDAVEGDSASVIMAQAERFGSDLVVTDMLDSDLLQTTRCPVLVARAATPTTSRDQRRAAHDPSPNAPWR